MPIQELVARRQIRTARRRPIVLFGFAGVCAAAAVLIARYPTDQGSTPTFWLVVTAALYWGMWRGSVYAYGIALLWARFAAVLMGVVTVLLLMNGSFEIRNAFLAVLWGAEALALGSLPVRYLVGNHRLRLIATNE